MNLCNISNLKRLMSEFGTGTKKGFGQNFLINEEIPLRIAQESCADGGEGVIEIGAGVGTLTQYLCESYKKVISVEIDKTMIPILDKTLSEYNNVKVINDDFLKLDLKSLICENFNDMCVSVCANLPYYITTPIIMKLLEEGMRENIRFSSITVMVQREVAKRLCAKSGSRDYGAITASIAYYGETTELFDVSPDNFMPPPKVTSTVMKIVPYERTPYKVSNEKLLFEVIAGAFAQRRKTLSNSLSSYFNNINKEKFTDVITSLGFDANVRGEKLSIEDFCRLTNKITEEHMNI